MKLPKIYNTYFLAVIATIGGMLFGFDISSMSAIIGTDQYKWYFNNPSGVLQGAIGSALAAGSVLGSLAAGPLSDKIGRRDSIFVACIFWLIGTAVQVSVQNVGQLIAGRIINGITVGITSSQVPVYLAEIARKEKRGSLIIIQQLAIEWGILFMFFIGYGASFIGGPKTTTSFRFAWGTQFIPCVLLMVGIPFLPRSPRWLAKVGRKEEAIHNLAKIQANGNTDDPLVVAEWEEITTVLEAERSAGPGWQKFIKRGMWKRTLAGMSVQAWQQMSGANAMVYYVVYIFSMAGLSGNINLISSGVQYALFIIFTTVMFFFIDRTGRRGLLIWGAIAMGVCHFIVAGLLSAGEYNPNGWYDNPNVVIRVTGPRANAVIFFCYLLIVIYALTLAPIAWIYAAEVWSLETRATGMALAATANWIFNFALGLFVPPAFKNITWKTFIVFGVLCMGAAVQAFFTYPETAGKTLEEIEHLFSLEGPLPWKTKKGESTLDAKVQEIADQSAEKRMMVMREEMGAGKSEQVENITQ